MEILGKIGKPNELEFQQMAAILSPLSIYGDSRKIKLPLLHNLRYKPLRLQLLRRSLRPPDASPAILPRARWH
jgi:hypothetical protein